MTARVVLAMDSATQRALVRLGLELSGEFEVVGTATDERDVEFIVSSLDPDIVLVHFPDLPGHGLEVVPTVRRASDRAAAVLYASLIARHEAHLTLAGHETPPPPTPIQVARLLSSVVRHPAMTLAC
jgi:chemotaxis response regulator CheB